MKNRLKFWAPDSGAMGGVIFGLFIVFIILLLMPPVMKFLHWWSAIWGV